MELSQAKVGVRVKNLLAFPGVPEGTEGIIDEDYGSGVMVAWDRPGAPLPSGYVEYDGRPAVATGILRDGFDKATELHYLEEVSLKGGDTYKHTHPASDNVRLGSRPYD